ncbi:MAG: hypothetical protein QMD13_06105, partial [Candidatus Bathyarchaeia archaeon]|nr:hypothetical protein [Candidatus Bathyarchaeia archaeon]
KTYFKVPEGELKLPEFFDTVKTLDQTVDVDYYLPGCPPASDQVAKAKQLPKTSCLQKVRCWLPRSLFVTSVLEKKGKRKFPRYTGCTRLSRTQKSAF